PAPQEPKPNLNITVEKITPKLNTNLDSFESQMGLQSKFFYLPPGGEAYISHAEDETKGWTLRSFLNIDQALDFASQGKVDATYQVKKIDFQTHKGEDLAKNTASSLEDSPLARFLGDNAHSLKAEEGTDYAVGKNEPQGDRSLNIMKGYAFLQKDKEYKFKSESDDGIRIKIGDKVLFNDEKALKGHHDRKTSEEDKYSVQETGFYELNIAHYDIGWGNATLKLFTIEDGKEVVVGDHKNGGIPLFTDISDMVIVDGKLGKVEGYEAEISVRTDIEANVDVKITDKEGGLINNVGSFDVSKDEVKTKTHTLQEPLKEDDLFTVEYKDEQGNVVSQASTTIKDSNAQVIEVEAIKVFEDTDAKTASHENSQPDTSGQDQDTQSENIDVTAIASLSEQSDNKPASGSLPQGILTQDNKEAIPGLESPKAEEGVVNSANETDTQASPSLAEQASETNTSSVVVPMNTEDTTTISGF
ncbi:PA14 domain-containing protein, partial [Campylobacter sp. RM15925]|uniref:PA14 domain-containing protein n=1 Tax=Campylobacter sp. RM15925 TaxID=1705724 RepID=UPI001475309C